MLINIFTWLIVLFFFAAFDTLFLLFHHFNQYLFLFIYLRLLYVQLLPNRIYLLAIMMLQNWYFLHTLLLLFLLL